MNSPSLQTHLGCLQVPGPTADQFDSLDKPDTSDNYLRAAVQATSNAAFARFNHQHHTAAKWDEFAHLATSRYLLS